MLQICRCCFEEHTLFCTKKRLRKFVGFVDVTFALSTFICFLSEEVERNHCLQNFLFMASKKKGQFLRIYFECRAVWQHNLHSFTAITYRVSEMETLVWKKNKKTVGNFGKRCVVGSLTETAMFRIIFSFLNTLINKIFVVHLLSTICKM